MNISVEEQFLQIPILRDMREEKEIFWINLERTKHLNIDKNGIISIHKNYGLSIEDINDAEARLARFAPFIRKVFPETQKSDGIIESVLTPISTMQDLFGEQLQCTVPGKFLLKQDSHLAVAGSVKARGGIYEVLCYTEKLAVDKGILKLSDNYEKLSDTECRNFFRNYTIQVGSTGNLGLSIGIMSAVIGFEVIVHMSADAKQWKKDLLRSYGVKVMEYDTDYSDAVRQGRMNSAQNPNSYFVDDENSKNLFLGYAVAAKRLVGQLAELDITVDEEHPLFVYLPCGVGGAPGGITFGLKSIFGDHVHCFFVEPVKAPCMALGMISGRNSEICVQDIGLSGKTHADGLAVGRPSSFVGNVMKALLDGTCTVEDGKLYDYMRDLFHAEGIFLEPSACAAFHGLVGLLQSEEGRKYIEENGLSDKMQNASHIAWATGGGLVPEAVRQEMLDTYILDNNMP